MRHIYLDQYSGIDSLITRISPRFKALSFIIIILSVVLTPARGYFLFFLHGLFIAALILLSRVPVFFIFKRSLAVIPFVLLATLFNLIASRGDANLFISIFIRSYLSILVLILLVATTKFSELLRAFEWLGCPKIITMIMSFMYRYIFVIEDEFMKMKQAKESRSVGGSMLFHAKALSNMMGSLFIRSYERAEAVYMAMLSRGFDSFVSAQPSFKAKRGTSLGVNPENSPRADGDEKR